jgi:hypothetical protein
MFFRVHLAGYFPVALIILFHSTYVCMKLTVNFIDDLVHSCMYCGYQPVVVLFVSVDGI